MGILQTKRLKYAIPGNAVKEGIKTYKETGNIGTALLDPSNKILKTPKNKKYQAIENEKKRKQKQIEMYAKAGRKPPGMMRGGKVKSYKHGGKVGCCRGMGAATSGGKFRKDG